MPEPTIEALLRRYVELIDRGDFASLGMLFAEGRITTADGATVAEGAGEVAALYTATTRRFDDGTPRTMHLTTNLVIDRHPSGSTATVESDFVVLQRVDAGQPIAAVVTGRYRDQLVRGSDGWRFGERCMMPGQFGDVARHLTFDPHAL